MKHTSNLHYRSTACVRSMACVRPRSGSLIIESVVAIALLATALVALGKLAASSAAISRIADQRLAATLSGENVIEQLKDVTFDDLSRESSVIANAIQKSCGYEINVTTDQFLVGDRDATHILVTVRPSTNVLIQLHDWRIKQTNPGAPEAEAPAAEVGDE